MRQNATCRFYFKHFVESYSRNVKKIKEITIMKTSMKLTMRLIRHKLPVAFALLGFLCCGEASAQKATFSKETFSYGGITLPYQRATIPGLGDKASLVIYLHGGSSKGNDNETQMQEPGINAISSWLSANNRKAIMLVPQCPTNMSWLGTMQNAIVGLLRTYIDRGVADAAKVYILGGSMGGTGTWNMLSNHPDLFAAAMPVAGNPTGLNAENVAKTPLFTVMGTADRIMKISNVETFLTDMDKYDAEYKFNIEEGWTHENVCEKSYTDERINWLFRHVKGETTGIADATDNAGNTVKVVWHSLSGQKLASEPTQRGVYIKTSIYGNGSAASEKCHINHKGQ